MIHIIVSGQSIILLYLRCSIEQRPRVKHNNPVSDEEASTAMPHTVKVADEHFVLTSAQ